MGIIDIKNLSAGYGKIPVIKDIDLEIPEGAFISIIGENGSGKTTFLRTVLGLQRPLFGEIILMEGISRKDIGYLPQQTDIQKDFPATVKEIVLSGCQGRASLFYSGKDKERATLMMRRMGIDDIKDKSYRTLSGGQKQRVLFARALCAAERILVLDEPTIGLDPEITQDMYMMLDEVNRNGMTVIMITHDIRAALEHSSHLLSMGEDKFFGTKEEYVMRFDLEETMRSGGRQCLYR